MAEDREISALVLENAHLVSILEEGSMLLASSSA